MVVIYIGLRKSKHHTEAGPAVFGGLESELGRRPRPLDRSGTGWSCLCPGYKQDVCFRGTQLGILIRESPFLRDGTA
jgi:hypothetical protein